MRPPVECHIRGSRAASINLGDLELFGTEELSPPSLMTLMIGYVYMAHATLESQDGKSGKVRESQGKSGESQDIRA
jgi:hypothetical protein